MSNQEDQRVPPRFIAEIGCNHKGDFEIAQDMIRMAQSFCSADVVKFQKRCNTELLPGVQYNAPHPEPRNSYGETYGEHREYLEFTFDQHAELKLLCEEVGITYSTSVWDLTSAKEIARLQPELIKVPSARNTDLEMLGCLCTEFSGEVHVSVGMTTRDEEEEIVSFFEKQGRSDDVVLYACTSGYPVDDEDVCLLEITRLREAYGSLVKEIGFSGHHGGIAIDMAAITLGAQWVERHFTLDRSWKGTDHAASLEPDGMRRLVRDGRCIVDALRYKAADIIDVEIVHREKLKYNNGLEG